MNRTPAILLISAVMTMACDPLIRVNGSVKDADGKPIAGATVVSDCNQNNENDRVNVVTDNNGAFQTGIIGCLDKKCVIQVEKDGYRPERFPVGENCERTVWGCPSKSTCNLMNLDVVLAKGPSLEESASNRAPVGVEQAIAAVMTPPSKPGGWMGNISPFELQVYYRLRYLRHGLRYEYDPSHAAAWEKSLLDEKADIYGRMCSAFFLLDKNRRARAFIEEQLKSTNLRSRYNAAKIVEMYVASAPEKKWGVDILVGLLADGTIDGAGVAESPPGEYPLGDRDDIMLAPIDHICWNLGLMKERRAVPALIAVLERRPRTGGAAFALGAIGDERAAPILMKLLKAGSGNDDRVVAALGKLKHRKAVPILIARLGNSKTTDFINTRVLLEALLAIGDPRAIAPIKRYLKGKGSRESKSVARRVYAQLKSSDPVKVLLSFFEKETYEPERSDIVSALVQYPDDDRVVSRLAAVARESDSAFMRREAIIGLRKIGNRQSLLVLASLLDRKWPKNLKAEWGWKQPPDFEVYFPNVIKASLQQCTGQNFGMNSAQWERWIKNNVE